MAAAVVAAAAGVPVVDTDKGICPMHSKHYVNQKSGQAMVEFIIGIIVVIVVFGGFIQIGLLSNERMTTYMRATHEAASLAVMPSRDPDHVPPAYTLANLIGDDEATYSEDDQRTVGSGEEVIDGIVSHALPDQLDQFIDQSPFILLNNGSDLNENFSMVRGDAHRTGIRLLPVVRNLIYGEDAIDVSEEVTTIWTRGIY